MLTEVEGTLVADGLSHMREQMEAKIDEIETSINAKTKNQWSAQTRMLE